MKLSKLLEITNLTNQAEFIEYQYGKQGQDTLIIDDNGIHYWYEAKLSSFEVFDNDGRKMQILRIIEKHFTVKHNQQIYYYAVCSILLAIGTWKKKKDKQFNIEEYVLSNLKSYVDRVVKEITDSLDFSQISEMYNLISIIKRDELYQQLVFNISEYNYSKNTKWYMSLEKPKMYLFGNLKNAEDLDTVYIDAYEDCVKLISSKEAHSFESTLNKSNCHNKITLEEKIVTALDNWRCNCTN